LDRQPHLAVLPVATANGV